MRDSYITFDRCTYCGPPAAHGAHPYDEQIGARLERAVRVALTTFEHGLHLDVEHGLLPVEEAKRIDRAERNEVNRFIGELHDARRLHVGLGPVQPAQRRDTRPQGRRTSSCS